MRLTETIPAYKSAVVNTEFSDRPDFAINPVQPKTMLVVIDPGVKDPQQLAKGALSKAHVAILKPELDGVAQITELLQRYKDTTSLHIISHGAPGTVYLGNNQLSLETLTQYAQTLRSWALPQLLLYGCNVAAGDAGSEFLERLHHLTGAKIAASSTLVGNADLGGNWHLDVTTHMQSVELAIRPSVANNYSGIFATLPDVSTIFSINGSATRLGADEIRLTSNAASQSGQAYSNARIDFNVNWDFTFDVYLGTADGGADGVGFVLHNDPAGSSATGTLGEGLGIGGVRNSIGIEFDTYQNTGEVASDHTSIFDPETGSAITLVTPFLLNNIEDGNYHRVVVSWNATLKTLAYTFDGLPMHVISRDLVSTDFGGSNLIYWGFGAATGGLTNEHRVRVIDFNGRLVNQLGSDIINTLFPAPDLIASSDTGLSDTDNVTSDVTPTFTGTAAPNATITLNSSVNGVVGTTTADGAGNWTITASTLAAGSHNITTTATVLGIIGVPSSPLTLTVDNVAPSLDIVDVSPDTSPTAPNSITINFGEAISGFDLTDFVLTRDGNPVDLTNATLTTNNNISWVLGNLSSIASADGDYELTLTSSSSGITDRAGNALTVNASETWTIDSTAPALDVPDLSDASDTGFSNTDNITSDTTPTLGGVTEPGSSVEIFVDGSSVTTVTANGAGQWSYTSSLSDGTYSITTITTDPIGNTGAESAPLNLTIDTSAPTVSLTSQAAGVVNGPFTVTASFSEAVTGFTVDDVTLVNATASNFSGAGDTYTFTVTPALDVAVSVDVAADVTQDLAGNNNQASTTQLNFTFDGTPPAQPTPPSLLSDPTGGGTGGSNAGNFTNSDRPTFIGKSEPGSTIQLFSGNVLLGTATTNSSGNWSYQPPATLADGFYMLTAQAKDAAGNTSPLSEQFPLTIDTQSATSVVVDVDQTVRDKSVDGITFRFSEVVQNFDLSEVVLRLNNESVVLGNASLTTSDNQTWTLGNIAGFTKGSGNYEISILPGDITDRAGNALKAGDNTTWLTGYTADAFAPQKFKGGKPGVKRSGGGESNAMRGGRLNDVMRGLGGNDALSGFGSNDTLSGGGGKDKVSGGGGKDRVRGQGGNDRLLGRQGDDLLIGGGGNDKISAGGGNDVVVGGTGNDILTGGGGSDTFRYTSVNDGTDTITDFDASADLIDLRSIFANNRFAGPNRFAQFNEFVELVQVGSAVEVRIDADGNGSGTALNTLAVLNNQSTNAVTSRSFIVG